MPAQEKGTAQKSTGKKLTELVVNSATPVPVAEFVSMNGTTNPAYLVVTALDRDAYAAGASDAVGAFLGDGASLALAANGNLRSTGIVFTWQSGQYVNAVYGALSALDFLTSGSAGDVTNISFFTTGNLALAMQDAAVPLNLLRQDASGYIGSATIVTDAHPLVLAGENPTPDSIAAAARTFVGRVWNDQGCWNLASTIAAEAGAGLPLSATALGVPGRGNGAWIVVYNGPLHAGLAWQSLVRAGDIITFGTPGGGGHITTCVAGAGATAMLIDNVTFQNALGQITNAAHDGAPADILIAAAHPATQEWAGVQADSVVIYALDTPVVTARIAAPLAPHGVTGLAALASITDPGSRPITMIQAYESGKAATLLLDGHAVTGGSAASLSAFSVQAGSISGAIALELRAFNGAYWGDWENITVQVAPPEPGMSMGALLDWVPGVAPLIVPGEAVLF